MYSSSSAIWSKAGITRAAGQRLFNKHMTGDFGPGKFSSVEVLIRAGMVEVRDGSAYVTDAGRQFCDENHMVMRVTFRAKVR